MKLFTFDAATDLVQVLTSAPYRLLVDHSDAHEKLKFGSFAVPPEQWQPAVLVWLVAEPTGDADPVGPILDRLEGNDARLVWDARLDVLASTAPWRRMVVVDFPSQSQALSWLRRDDITTERTLSHARVTQLALLLFVRA